jgi:hypothetical protein
MTKPMTRPRGDDPAENAGGVGRAAVGVTQQAGVGDAAPDGVAQGFQHEGAVDALAHRVADDAPCTRKPDLHDCGLPQLAG